MEKKTQFFKVREKTRCKSNSIMPLTISEYNALKSFSTRSGNY